MEPTPQIIFRAIGRLDGKITGIEERFKRLESNTEFIRSAVTEDGKQIAEISERCRLRARQISQLVERVGGMEEATGKIKFKDENEQEKKQQFRWGLTTLVSILAVAASVAIWVLSR